MARNPNFLTAVRAYAERHSTAVGVGTLMLVLALGGRYVATHPDGPAKATQVGTIIGELSTQKPGTYGNTLSDATPIGVTLSGCYRDVDFGDVGDSELSEAIQDPDGHLSPGTGPRDLPCTDMTIELPQDLSVTYRTISPLFHLDDLVDDYLTGTDITSIETVPYSQNPDQPSQYISDEAVARDVIDFGYIHNLGSLVTQR